MEKITSIEDYVVFHTTAVETMFMENKGMEPFITYLIHTKQGEYRVLPLEIPTDYFGNNMGKTFIKNILLEGYLNAVKSNGDEVVCVVFTSEAWRYKNVKDTENYKDSDKVETLVITIEKKDGVNGIISYEITRDENGTPSLTTPEAVDFENCDGGVRGIFSNILK